MCDEINDEALALVQEMRARRRAIEEQVRRRFPPLSPQPAPPQNGTHLIHPP